MRIYHWIGIGVCAVVGFGAASFFLDSARQPGELAAPEEPHARPRISPTSYFEAAHRADGLIPVDPTHRRVDAAQQSSVTPAPSPEDVQAKVQEERAQGEARMREHLATTAASFARDARDQRSR
jgi:hypothetical protein